MKTSTTLSVQAPARPWRVKYFLLSGIICLASDNFCIFASVIATIISWFGLCVDNTTVIGYGAVAFLSGFTPWLLRASLRLMRQYKSGSNKW